MNPSSNTQVFLLLGIAALTALALLISMRCTKSELGRMKVAVISAPRRLSHSVRKMLPLAH